jgi:hypothetical protein
MCGDKVATRVLHGNLREGGPTVLAPKTRCAGEREVYARVQWGGAYQ